MIIRLRKSLSIIPLGILCLALTPDATNLTPPPGRMKALPVRTLWVWERPEDLSTLDPRTTAIATLDHTILLGRTATVIPRRQSFVYPAGITRIAVVRVEAPGLIGPGLEHTVAGLVLDALADPGVAALQVDFLDARRSPAGLFTSVFCAISAAGCRPVFCFPSRRSPRGAGLGRAGSADSQSTKPCPCSSEWNPIAATLLSTSQNSESASRFARAALAFPRGSGIPSHWRASVFIFFRTAAGEKIFRSSTKTIWPKGPRHETAPAARTVPNRYCSSISGGSGLRSRLFPDVFVRRLYADHPADYAAGQTWRSSSA